MDGDGAYRMDEDEFIIVQSRSLVVAAVVQAAEDFQAVVADVAADVPAAAEQVAVGDWKHYNDTRNFC